ncbi:MAG: hypothetical protein ONA90_04665 [candidate division KSB1 bacterium]|nr:hypothetical protein [candidate division KSB1 bacterium]
MKITTFQKPTRRHRHHSFVFTAILLLCAACSNEPTGPQNFSVSLAATNLQRLPSGEGHYELWISFPEQQHINKIAHGDEDFVSFGKFNLSEDNSRILNLQGEPMVFAPAKEIDINLAVDAIITIEVQGDTDDKPGSRLLGGEFVGNDREATATLTTAAEDAFDFDYTLTSGVYILATPTTNDTADFNRGIWWMNPASSTNATAGLQQLSALSDTSGWKYEGWVIDKSGAQPLAYSTGKFLRGSGFDEDFAGPYAGPDSDDRNGDGRGDGFPFPGQDFIPDFGNIPPLSKLDSGFIEARMTLEPHPDNSPGPFQLEILVDPVIGPDLDGANSIQSMENRANRFPTARVKINR